MKLGLAPLLIAALALASPARASGTPAPAGDAAAAAMTDDPIADLLQNLPPDQTTDMDPEDAAAPPPADAVPAPPRDLTPMVAPPPKQDPVVTAPRPPSSYVVQPPASARSRLPQLDRPVMIGETGRRPDAPPTDVDMAYENRVRASLQSAQGLQGALDGGWTVRDGTGAGIYVLQLVDRGGYGPLEGAWRALSGGGRVGLIDSLDRQPSVLTIRITRTPGRAPAVLTLVPQAGGVWSGEIVDDLGSRPVTMRRN